MTMTNKCRRSGERLKNEPKRNKEDGGRRKRIRRRTERETETV